MYVCMHMYNVYSENTLIYGVLPSWWIHLQPDRYLAWVLNILFHQHYVCFGVVSVSSA